MDYLVRTYYDLILERSECPDFREPKIITFDQSLIEISLLLAYHSFPYDGPIKKLGEFIYKTSIPFSETYSLFLLNCVSNHQQSKLKITGYSIFHNSFGYLSSEEYPKFIYSSALTIFYALLFCYYIFLMFVYRKNLHFYQKILLIDTLLAFVAFLVQSLYLHYQNNSGSKNKTLTYIVSFLINTWPSLLRFIIILLTEGYKIIIYSPRKKRLIINLIYSLTFFITGTISSIITQDLIITILSTIMEFSFFIWLNINIYWTISIIPPTRNVFKKKLFTKIKLLIYVSFSLSYLFVLFSYILPITYGLKFWRFSWVLNFYFEISIFGSIFLLMFWFKPRKNNLIFNYDQEDPPNYNMGNHVLSRYVESLDQQEEQDEEDFSEKNQSYSENLILLNLTKKKE